jgi:glyoxylase-like metal-dependent hydrolase (beta-lactamase superfamily II)
MRAERAAADVFRLRTAGANVYLVRDRPTGVWVLVDAGMPGCARTIRRAAQDLFGKPPIAILLTHGHFDHVGGLPALADEWGVPVYAHPLELPYLTGRSKYPPYDPTAGGGVLSWLSPLYPRGTDLGPRVRMLPLNGVVPGLSRWQWLLTSGNTPGHVSFFREDDRTLIAGDAVATTREESLTDLLFERPIVWRPAAFSTTDWIAARRSVETIAALDPNVLATGHGPVMRAAAMRRALRDLADRFDEYMPSSGRYVPYPAVADERGSVHVPPKPGFAVSRGAIAAGLTVAAVGVGLMALSRRRTRSRAIVSGAPLI